MSDVSQASRGWQQTQCCQLTFAENSHGKAEGCPACRNQSCQHKNKEGKNRTRWFKEAKKNGRWKETSGLCIKKWIRCVENGKPVWPHKNKGEKIYKYRWKKKQLEGN